ncbi:MAG: phage holin family protein [Dehalococcoidia bacterium]
MHTLLFRALVNALGLWLASVIVPGVHVDDWQSLVVGTALFAIVNTLFKPLAAFVSCFLIVATFGLFLLVLNAAMLALAAWLAGVLGMNFRVDGFRAAVFGALVISLVSVAASLIAPRR